MSVLNQLNFRGKVINTRSSSLMCAFVVFVYIIVLSMPKNNVYFMNKVNQLWQKNRVRTFQICRKDTLQSSINWYVNRYGQQAKDNKLQIISNYSSLDRISYYQYAHLVGIKARVKNEHRNKLMKEVKSSLPILASTATQTFSHDLITLMENARNQKTVGINAIKKIFSPSLFREPVSVFTHTRSSRQLNLDTDRVPSLELILPRQSILQNVFSYHFRNQYQTIPHRAVFSHAFLAKSFDFIPNLTNTLTYTEDFTLNGSSSPSNLEPSNFLQPSIDQQIRYEMRTGFFDQRLLLRGAFIYMIRQNQIRDIKKDSNIFFIQRDKQVHQSVDLGAIAKLTRNWQILSSLAYAHASITNDSETAVIGNTPRKIPRWKVQLRNQFNVVPITGFKIFTDSVYIGVRPGDDLNSFNLAPLITMGFGFGYKRSWQEDRLSIAAEITNLLGASLNQNRNFEMLDRIPDSFKLSFNSKF